MNDQTQTPSQKKKKWYTQSFKEEWLEDPEFMDWLQQDKNNKEASFCKCCNVTLRNANKSMLLKHKTTVKHKKSFYVNKSSENVIQFMMENKSEERDQKMKGEPYITDYYSEVAIASTPPTTLMPKSHTSSRKRYNKKWRESWKMEPLFSGWLQKSRRSTNEKHLAFCTICNSDVTCGKSEITRHASSSHHKSMSQHDRSVTSSTFANDQLEKGKRISTSECSVRLTTNLTNTQHPNLNPYTSAGGIVRPNSNEESNSRLPKQWTKATISKLAPDWDAPALIDGQFKQLKLTDFRGKYLIFFFYPLDFTFVCPTEIIAFSDRIEEFHSINTEVVACSIDSHFTHLAWTKVPRKEGGLDRINIPLLSDISHSISMDYGVYLEDQAFTLSHELQRSFYH